LGADTGSVAAAAFPQTSTAIIAVVDMRDEPSSRKGYQPAVNRWRALRVH
jgi:hypothetical protein